MRSMVWALGAALLVASGPAFAGGGAKGDVELGIYGGYGFLDDYGTLLPKDGPLFGARLGYFFTPNVSLEASGQRLSTHRDTVGGEDVDLHFDAGRLNLLYNFRPGEELRPFLTAGVGYERVEVVDGDHSSNVGWNAGAGLRWFPTPRWNVRLDGRYVGSKPDELDELQSNYEASLGLSLLFGGGGEKVESASAAPANQPPTVTCAAERTQIMPGENVTVRATATDPEGDPLTYQWTTTAGHVSGTDASATLDFTGATAPSSATVTVRVSDNHGNSATSDCSVSLAAPAPPAAQAVSCLAGGFPRNLSRLTNVDKACLDDVATRLKADPRATVTVIGNADSHERTADQIADARAKAVRDYLTQSGIETSRITARSAAATKPLDTATDTGAQARNRRVEVWFVPEGATIPE
jgi:outer membrane protein OmpA-like peptidoglycan-associated protein/opacity protein-like surface antigen